MCAIGGTLSNSDYTLLEYALKLGGSVTEVTLDPTHSPFLDYVQNSTRSENGMPVTEGLRASSAGGAVTGALLSTSHIGRKQGAFIEWHEGASLLKTCKGGETEKVGGGQRQAIKGFSNNSRRRLLRLIGSIRLDAPLPLFVTLTYPELFPTAHEAKRHLKMFHQRLNYYYPSIGLIWKQEPQQRGAPHFHSLLYGATAQDLYDFVPTAWSQIAGGGDEKHIAWHYGLLGRGNKHCVEPVRHWRGVWNYAAKYLGKTFEVPGWENVGRYWGTCKRENIPFGELKQQEVHYKKVVDVQRLQRRFSGLKKATRSVTIFCDANQWIEKLEVV